MISFIVSAYERPKTMGVALKTIAAQTEPHEIIVACNGNEEQVQAHRQVAKEFGAEVYPTGEWGAYCCYSSAELIIERGLAKGDWLSFPSDDTILFACFSDLMMGAARENSWDLVYCDMVYDRPAVRYGLLEQKPQLNEIDKTGFIMRRSWFNGFPGKRRDGRPTAADGLLIEELVARKIRHGKAPGILLVHQ